jgi:hypothetical protein
MKHVLRGIMMVLFVQGLVLAQTGSVSGTVADNEGNLLEGARVTVGPPCDGLEIWTDVEGAFLFPEVEPGEYLARAGLLGVGMDALPVSVVADEETVVDFVLHMGPHGHPHHPPHGGHWPHDWEEIALFGWAIVVPSEDNPEVSHYFFDEDNDGEPEYRLGFGPWWYEPDSGAQRPENGDEVDIMGGLIGFHPGSPDLEVVIVWELNGETWFDPDGYGHHEHYPEVMDVAGWSVVLEEEDPCNQYWLDEDGDGVTEYRLAFGPPEYDPGNGATRPVQDDWVEITGGLMEHHPAGATIVVYEINGLFWRSPGDTTGLTIAYEVVGETAPLARPQTIDMVSAYPNPFNPTTTIQFTIMENSAVEIEVYNMLGEQVATLEDNYMQAGTYTREFDGSGLSSGLYLVRLQAGSQSEVARVLLAK